MSRVVFGIIPNTNAIGYLILNHRWFISDCYLIYSRRIWVDFYSLLRLCYIIALFKSNIEWKHLRTHSGNCDLEYLFNYFIISLWTCNFVHIRYVQLRSWLGRWIHIFTNLVIPNIFSCQYIWRKLLVFLRNTKLFYSSVVLCTWPGH